MVGISSFRPASSIPGQFQDRPLPSLCCNLVLLWWLKQMELSERFNSVFEFLPKDPIFREFQDQSPAGGHESCWNPEESPSDGSSHLLFCSPAEGLFFEPIHQIVGQHHQFKVNLRASPTPAHTLVQPETIDAFLCRWANVYYLKWRLFCEKSCS